MRRAAILFLLLSISTHPFHIAFSVDSNMIQDSSSWRELAKRIGMQALVLSAYASVQYSSQDQAHRDSDRTTFLEDLQAVRHKHPVYTLIGSGVYLKLGHWLHQYRERLQAEYPDPSRMDHFRDLSLLMLATACDTGAFFLAPTYDELIGGLTAHKPEDISITLTEWASSRTIEKILGSMIPYYSTRYIIYHVDAAALYKKCTQDSHDS